MPDSIRPSADQLVLAWAKGRQPLDSTFAASQVVEKSLDRRGAGAVAVADIANYHDSNRWPLQRQAMGQRK
eukprot:2684530-Pyramimonas_sp.AAC.1